MGHVLGGHGEFFFHYTKADTAFGAIVPNQTIRLSPYERMSDPFESKEWLMAGAGGVPDEKDTLNDQLSEQSALINRAKKATKVLSLSVDAEGYYGENELFGRGHARASMWQMYAENHAGVCLAFDRKMLIQELTSQLEASGRPFHEEVRYPKGGISEVDPGAELFLIEPGEDAEAAVARHIEAHYQALFFTKLADWQSEWEYRFIVLGKGSDYLLCSTKSLRAVMLGERFPPWQGESARKLCEDLDVPLHHVQWENWRPLLLPGPPRPSREAP